MSDIDNGGSAFPTHRATFDPVKDVVIMHDGMTLRDHFAGLAMQAQVATDMVPGEACDQLVEMAEAHGQDVLYRLALNSYEIADAMIKARKEGGAA
jgi:hypothetical protein